MKQSIFKSPYLRAALFRIGLLVCVFVVIPEAGHSQITDEDIATLFEDDGAVDTSQATLRSGPGLGEMLVRMTIALGAVLGLLGGGFWLLRKYGPKSPLAGKGGSIRVLANHSIGQRRSVMMVRVQDKTLVLGVTPSNISCLTELEDTDYDEWHHNAQQAILSEANTTQGGTTDFGGIER